MIISDINYNETVEDKEREEITLICTPQREKRGYKDLRVPILQGPSAFGIFLSWAMLMRPRTVLILPHTFTGPPKKRFTGLLSSVHCKTVKTSPGLIQAQANSEHHPRPILQQKKDKRKGLD